MRVLGFMSGTSLDGVDAAIIETDGNRVLGFGAAASVPFTGPELAAILATTNAALAGRSCCSSAAAAEAAVHSAHLRAVTALRAPDNDFTLAGFHGQTVLHRPGDGFTWQVGDAERLATALGVSVVADLRQADLAAGGVGAPLVPAYHAALARSVGLSGPCAFLNIGGVANLTLIDPDGPLRACDTGPGNGMMDLLLQHRGEGCFDDGGQIAAAGTVNEAVLARLLSNRLLQGCGPRALDRYDFELAALASMSTPDALATLVAFAAECVAKAAQQLPVVVRQWYVCGGGRHNRTLMQALRQRLGHCENIDVLGLRGDFIEAEAMAFLALRSLEGRPITFPHTTGVAMPMTGGVLYRPRRLPAVSRKAQA